MLELKCDMGYYVRVMSKYMARFDSLKAWARYAMPKSIAFFVNTPSFYISGMGVGEASGLAGSCAPVCQPSYPYPFFMPLTGLKRENIQSQETITMSKKPTKKYKRKSISKKLRFEVFKRDEFRCLYCGQTPPKVVLEIDHFEPVSKGGTNDINNLVTACFDCNRGKRDTPMDQVPSKLIDNLESIKEKESQIKAYRNYINEIQNREMKDVDDIGKMFSDYYDGKTWVSDSFKEDSLLYFIKHLPKHEVEEAMKITLRKENDPEMKIKYFCGVCWRKIKGRCFD